MIWGLRLKHNNLYSNILLYLLILISTKIGYSQNIEKKEPTKISNLATKEVLKIIVVPRIKMTEKNSLKSYSWWISQTEPLETEMAPVSVPNKLKIPVAFKQVLKKMKDDFLKENIDMEFMLSNVNSSNIKNFENYYLITGNLILDSKNIESADLNEISFYQIKNSALNLVFLSRTGTFTSDSSFRGLTQELNDQILNKSSNKIYEKHNSPGNEYQVIFESELTFEELGQIRVTIKDSLGIGLENVQLYTSENNKYTFKIYAPSNPFEVLKKLVFVNGPYKNEILDNQIIFKTYSENELLEP